MTQLDMIHRIAGASMAFAHVVMIEGNIVSWPGEDVRHVSPEYSWLPAPLLPVPLQYLVWVPLIVIVFVWGVLLKR